MTEHPRIVLADYLLAAEIENHILVQEEDSVRDDWWRASCGLHDWYTTGSKPNVEDAAAHHVAWEHTACAAVDPDSAAAAPLYCRMLPEHTGDHFNGGRSWANDRGPAERDTATLMRVPDASRYFATDMAREGFLTLFGNKPDSWFTPEFVHYLRHGVYPATEQPDERSVLTDARLDEIDRCLGAGGSYTGAPTKQELRTALIELVDEVRRQRRAARAAIPAMLPRPSQDALEAENRKLWERAAKADLARVQAELRAAKLRLVLASTLRLFSKKRRGTRDEVRSGWVEAARVAQWRRVFNETRPGVEQQ